MLTRREDDASGETRLVAYLTHTGTSPGDRSTARASAESLARVHGAERVRDAGDAAADTNGKVDRRALPAPEGDAFAQKRYEAPVGEVEVTLAQLWSELLGVESIGRQDNFFELGGHSLLAVQLISRMRQRLGIELSLQELFTQPVLMELAEQLAKAARSTLEHHSSGGSQ